MVGAGEAHRMAVWVPHSFREGEAHEMAVWAPHDFLGEEEVKHSRSLGAGWVHRSVVE